jgi:hypothetical protein
MAIGSCMQDVMRELSGDEAGRPPHDNSILAVGPRCRSTLEKCGACTRGYGIGPHRMFDCCDGVGMLPACTNFPAALAHIFARKFSKHKGVVTQQACFSAFGMAEMHNQSRSPTGIPGGSFHVHYRHGCAVSNLVCGACQGGVDEILF